MAPLPIPDTPNTRIHADLFGPMVDASRKSAYILCITDAFTKYAVVTSIQYKDAQTVAKAIFEQWFCKFGIPAQIHTDGGKEFVNKLLAELCEVLNVQHTKTTPYHPQCNAQVEVFNKTVKKYLASYVDETTLNWEEFLPALLEFAQDCHHFRHRKSNNIIMANRFLQSDYNYYNMPVSWHAKTPKSKV